jgi:type I restriction-modification system DNA methylase subunit
LKNNSFSNFDILRAYEAQLWRLGASAERYFAEDPNTSLLKLRQLYELLAQSLAARTGQYFTPRDSIDSIVTVMQTKLDDVIQDPASGTGGFLIAANNYLRAKYKPEDRSEAQQHLLRHGAGARHPPPGADEHAAARH